MLKALELTGFKSFADKTRFEFHRGITVVVGPNGSGKSNVVDAIKWVLGSQSAKSLRGSEMTDVIFNGSGSRGGLNTAEVTLVLDNSEGRYQRDTREVAITRRVYRSGEGEYLINGAACRLRDIRDLLAGTGIGTEAYSIIEQGKVDALLQASPKDRRAIFEEAAGVSRFRAKRQEAARRLARVEQNLLRLSDIVDEVESRLRSVRLQAGKAQRYREGSRRLKELRTQLGVADWWQLTDRLASLNQEQLQFHTQDDDRRKWMEEAEEELPRLEGLIDQATSQIAELDRQIATEREQAIANQATASGLLARHADLAANLKRLEEQWVAAQQPEPEPQTPQVDVAAQLRQTDQEFQLALAAEQELAQRESQLATHVQHGRQRLAELQRRHTTLVSQQAVVAQKVAMQREQLAAERQKLAMDGAQRDQLASDHRAVAARLATASEESRVATDATQQAAARLAEARQGLATCQQQLASHVRDYQALQQELTSLEHRKDLTEELDREQHLHRQQVRQFVAGISHGQAPVVAELLHVDVDTAPLIEAALGGLTEYFVLPSTSPLIREMGAATRSVPPGARMVRLDWRPPVSSLDRIDLSGFPGVWGRADQFVEADADYAPLVKRLLGRTWIVDSIATAVELATSAGQGLHFVTADGDVVGADGTLVVGPQRQARGSLTRRSQIDQFDERIAQITPQVNALRERVASLEGEQRRLEQQLELATEHHAGCLAHQSEVGQSHAALEGREQVLATQLGQLQQVIVDREAYIAALETECEKSQQAALAADTQQQQLEASCRGVEVALTAADQQWQALRDELREAQLASAKLQQQCEVLASMASTPTTTPDNRQVLTELSQQIESLRQRLAEVDEQRLACNAAEAESIWRRDQLLPEREAWAQKRQEYQHRRDTLRNQLQQLRRQLEETQSRKNQLELAVAKIEHQRQALADRLRDDYEIDLPAVAASAPDHRPEVDRKQVEQEIEELRTTLSRIGSVNVDALEEIDQIETRYEAISSQYRDLSQAKASLERLMTRLSTESRQLFLATVETVRGHFQELFRRLFGGGEADIVLEVDENNDDAMECGVEIRACPPGKETRNISLLSGGEKTMTCVALLLAMFRSKPSPFCVLDEVDAALDEANVGRFTGVLSDFLSSTQFVVITHSKKTMTGADTLYGVTMQEGGVSKQVSVRFDDVTDDGFIKPSAMARSAGGGLADAA